MKQRLSWFILLGVLLVGAAPIHASSIPSIQGSVAGIELCDQAMCGSAIFVSIFNGQIGNARTIGTLTLSVNHPPLPGPDDPPIPIVGVWLLQPLFGHSLSGSLAGTLDNNGDGTYHVVGLMQLASPGVGTAHFDGTLSHNTYPPTIGGHIFQ